MSELGGTLIAFLFLAASLAVGRMVHADGGLERSAGAMAMRGSAVVLMALAVVAVGLAAIGLRGAVLETRARMAAFSGELTRLDTSLRLAGDMQAPAREALFRYVDHMARETFPRSTPGMAAEPGGLEALRDGLRDAVAQAGIAAGIAAGGTDRSREMTRTLESFLAAADTLLAATDCILAPWCKAVLGSWLLAGLATLGVMVARGRASLTAAIGLAVALAVGVHVLEGGSAVFAAHFLMSSQMLEAALYAIAD